MVFFCKDRINQNNTQLQDKNFHQEGGFVFTKG